MAIKNPGQIASGRGKAEKRSNKMPGNFMWHHVASKARPKGPAIAVAFRLTPFPRKSAACSANIKSCAALATGRSPDFSHHSPPVFPNSRSVTMGFVRDYSGGAVLLAKFISPQCSRE